MKALMFERKEHLKSGKVRDLEQGDVYFDNIAGGLRRCGVHSTGIEKEIYIPKEETKTYEYEGEEYIKDGDKYEYPDVGDTYLMSEGSPMRCAHKHTKRKAEILILKEEKMGEKSKVIGEEEKEALEGSVEKWDDILEGEGEDMSDMNCPLCKLHLQESTTKCPKCIVCKETGETGCKGIGWHNWQMHIYEQHKHSMGSNFKGYIIYCPECRTLAQNVRDGLQKILDRVNVQAAKERYFVKIDNPEVAIGEGRIRLEVVDEHGGRAASGYLLSINENGAITLIGEVNPDVGLDLDDNLMIKVVHE